MNSDNVNFYLDEATESVFDIVSLDFVGDLGDASCGSCCSSGKLPLLQLLPFPLAKTKTSESRESMRWWWRKGAWKKVQIQFVSCTCIEIFARPFLNLLTHCFSMPS